MIVRNQRFNAKRIALRISPSFSLDKVVISDPMFDYETVCMWSQLTAQSLCMAVCWTTEEFQRRGSLGKRIRCMGNGYFEADVVAAGFPSSRIAEVIACEYFKVTPSVPLNPRGRFFLLLIEGFLSPL